MPVEFYEKGYRMIRLVGIPSTRQYKMKKGGKIEWVVPLADLLSIDELGIQASEIAGREIHAELSLVAVLGYGKRAIDSNARQVSQKLLMPVGKAKQKNVTPENDAK